MENTTFALIMVLASLFSNFGVSQVWENQSIGSVATMDFDDLNSGWIAVGGTVGYKILKTSDKGVSWDSIYGFNGYAYSENISIDRVNSDLGFIYYGSKIVRTTNGGDNWTTVYELSPYNIPGEYSLCPVIKFYDSNTGYFSYTRYDKTNGVKIFRTTNGGNNWVDKRHVIPPIDRYYQFMDLTFENNSASYVTFCGFEGHQTAGWIRFYGSRSDNGGEYFNDYAGTITSSIYKFKYINYLPSQTNTNRLIGIEYIDNNNKGTYCYEFQNGNIGSGYKISDVDNINKVGGLKFIDQNTGYVLIQQDLYKTSNAGVNWSVDYTVPEVAANANSNIFMVSGDQIFLGTFSGSLYVKRLTTNFATYFDNQSSSSSLLFDGSSYNTPSTNYLRGGNSSLSTSAILNSGQSNERIFYKWYDNNMETNKDFYFDMSGNTFSNHFKTKQLSNVTSAISNSSQSKSIRDTTINGSTLTHTIHESIGGIFYSKSTNYGESYQVEEVVNKSLSNTVSDGNKNASLSIMRHNGSNNPITLTDANRNVAVVWERYNSSTGKVEIKLATRVQNIPQTGYEWKMYVNNGNEFIDTFSAPSNFECKPQCFILANLNDLQNSGLFTIIVPHLRPNGSQNKIVTSVRYSNQSQNYELDNGSIQDLSVTSPFNYYSSHHVHFAYMKDDKVVYRREEFGFYSGNIYKGSSPEVQSNVSFGDGYSSRYTPDISIMGGVPVITYAASYYASRLVVFENDQTYYIPITRFPIVKVHRINSSTWSNFVIYNSNSVQSDPDIEGSKDTKSYLINYSLNNGQFKKVVNAYNYPGYFCQPSIFSGTDSRLISGSYSGSLGNNLSLLTLSPQSSVYKIDKQNFIITNLTSSETFDVENIDGVVNLDTIKYSFKLGPIFIQDILGGLEGGIFEGDQESEDPILNSVEFNENLKSSPFVLNEEDALLLGSTASYIKDNSYYSISEIPYTVKLYNKRTDTLHRILFQDTIHSNDSIETEFLRGFYIEDIPNDEDSFYVKLEVNESFEDANYFINPIYEDEYDTEGDNSTGGRLAVIFEDNSNPNAVYNIPAEFDLKQNYPNPFNPSTTIRYSIANSELVNMSVYDISGREVLNLVNEFKNAGSYSVKFNGTNFASGVYFYRIEAGKFVQTKRMLLIK
ncbi:MAG: T9SS type A sorting domain-containing protein [Ignavibacteria bacterium]|nr:T9SS type A sorting domain-containing protein [Ignavibacteria bacterium]